MLKEVPPKPIQDLFGSFADMSAKALAESFLNVKAGTISTWEAGSTCVFTASVDDGGHFHDVEFRSI